MRELQIISSLFLSLVEPTDNNMAPMNTFVKILTLQFVTDKFLIVAGIHAISRFRECFRTLASAGSRVFGQTRKIAVSGKNRQNSK